MQKAWNNIVNRHTNLCICYEIEIFPTSASTKLTRERNLRHVKNDLQFHIKLICLKASIIFSQWERYEAAEAD